MLKEMEYIYAVYQQKSFSKAAQKLFISQPALSAAVKQAEQRLKVTLFDRSTKPITLTQAGKYYIESVEKIMAIQQDMAYYFSTLTEGNSGSINIGSSTYFCTYVLPQLLTELKKQAPELAIHLHEAASTRLLSLLEEEKVDFVLDAEAFSDPKFQSYVWKAEQILLAVPAANPINQRLASQRFSFADIRNGLHHNESAAAVDLSLFCSDTFILLKAGSDMHQRALTLCKNAGFSPKTSLFTDQMLTSYNQAERGFGLVFVRDTITEYVEHTDQLFFYKINDPLATRSINVTLKKSHILSKVTADFLINTLCVDLDCTPN